MLWDPTFDTWRRFGVSVNSQMVLLSADLTSGTELFFGFGSAEQDAVLEALPSFA